MTREKCDKTARRANQFRFSEIMLSPRIKNIAVYQNENQVHIFAHPVPLRGRRPSSRTLDGLRWTLVYAETMAWIGVRQNRVVLAPVAGVKLSEKLKLNRW